MGTFIGSSREGGFASARSRGVTLLKYGLWATAFGFLLLTATLSLSAAQHWLTVLDSVRQILGFHRPPTGPDWFLCCGVAVALVVPLGALVMLSLWYRKVWIRRLQDVWQTKHLPAAAKVLPLRSGANELQIRIDYLRALVAAPGSSSEDVPDPGRTSDTYKIASEAVLKNIEADVSERAIALGLAVGVSHSRGIDLFTIAAAALELQLHVLTRLGKRPSLAMWNEMLTRTCSSLFVNTYLNRNESLALRIGIKKMGLGLEAASEMIDHAASSIGDHLNGAFDHHGSAEWTHDDADWDDAEHVFAHPLKVGPVTLPIAPLFEAARLATGTLISVGTFGLRELGVFIDAAGDELFQGAVAGGILYFHGMAVAADCLALNVEHRESPAMTRTIGQCVGSASWVAGHVLRDAVRSLRAALKEKRRRVVSLASGKVAEGISAATEQVGEHLSQAGEQVKVAVASVQSTAAGIATGAKDISTEVWEHTRVAGQKTAEVTSNLAASVTASVRKIIPGHHPSETGNSGATK